MLIREENVKEGQMHSRYGQAYANKLGTSFFGLPLAELDKTKKKRKFTIFRSPEFFQRQVSQDNT